MAENNFRALQSANKGKTYFLLASRGLLTWLVTYAAMTYFGVGTASTMVPMAVGFALFGVWGSYYGSDKLVLTMTGAKLITREDAPELFNVIEEVVIASGLPMPKVAIVEDTAPTLGGNLNTNGYTISANVGNVKFGGNIQINNTLVAPSAVTDATVVYAATPSAGASGVFVVNGEAVNEELITKKRAFAFSILL